MAGSADAEALRAKMVDGLLSWGGVRSASGPGVVAAMLEQLDVRPGHRVLEVGAGTGYNAACLAELAGPSGFVTTIDIGAEMVADARRGLAAAGYDRVRVV